MRRLLAACLAVPVQALAGGGPWNVVVVYNADVPDARGVADAYAEARDIPLAHLCGVSGVDPKQGQISLDDYRALIGDPVAACVAAVPYPEDIDYLVLVRGLPYRVVIPDGFTTSLSAMLQVGEAKNSLGVRLTGIKQRNTTGNFQASIENPHHLWGTAEAGDFTIDNPYSAWYTAGTRITRAAELPPSFRRKDAGARGGWDFEGNLFVVTRLDGFDYQDALDLIDRGVAADGTFPDAELVCMRASDAARGARDPECEYVTRHLQASGFNAAWLDTFDGVLSGRSLAALWTGTTALQGALDHDWVPGAIAGNLTSFGAVPNNFFCSEDGITCPASESQTSIARFVRAGATGAHGTASEPLNNTFPNAGTLLLYTFGYSLGESWFYNQLFLYWQNVYLGDPLTAPWAERPVPAFAAEVPEGEPLVVTASHPDGVATLTVYVDGVKLVEVAGDTVEVPLDGTVGEQREVFAVAIAENASVERPGWQNPSQRPQPDVQGWAVGTVTIGEPLPVDTGDTGDTGQPEPPAACGCTSAPSPIAAVLLPLLALFSRRAGGRGQRPR